jgi:hypothetical protein
MVSFADFADGYNTTIDHKQYKNIRTQDHALYHHWPQKDRFEPKTMHYTTIDPQKDQIRTQDHALPGMHYTTIDHEGHINILLVDIKYVHVHFNTTQCN